MLLTSKNRFSGLLILELSLYDGSVYAERALRAGAVSYIMKQVGAENVISAIRKVIDYKILFRES